MTCMGPWQSGQFQRAGLPAEVAEFENICWLSRRVVSSFLCKRLVELCALLREAVFPEQGESVECLFPALHGMPLFS
jgi:hypothetical protein